MDNAALSIRPLDTVFFKDGKPFSMGEETNASGIFPPPPSVYYGALRTVYFSKNDIENVKKIANTHEDQTTNLYLNGIFYRLANDGENKSFFAPCPLDCVVEKDGQSGDAIKLGLTDNNSISSIKTGKVLQNNSGKEIESDSSAVINVTDLNKYLNGNFDFKIRSLSHTVELEPKTGIGRNYETKTTSEGMLYNVNLRRLIDFDFIVKYSGLDLGSNGFMKLGAEGKASYYEKIDSAPIIEKTSIDANKFKLYFLTPAVFENGWLPSWISEDLTGNYNGIGLKLLSAAVGKPIRIGGWDMQKRRPKPMRLAIPSGSVYFFEITNNVKVEDVFNAFHEKSVTDFNLEKQGFGIAYVGKCI